MKVLVVYEEHPIRHLCCAMLAQEGFDTSSVSTTDDALDALARFRVDAVLTALRIPQIGGIELLKSVRERYPDIPVILMTCYGTIESAVEAMQFGAEEYVAHDLRAGDLHLSMAGILRFLHQLQQTRALHRQLSGYSGFGEMTGLSPEMKRMYQLIEKVAKTKSPVLILGESGTGKELVARCVHSLSPRRDQPFVPIDCSALTPTLIESELFGYAKGAFTGAMEARRGLIESAEDGTLFFDEIGDLPLDLQPKLLRVLQQREIRRLGSNDHRPISARIIAATNRDLETAVREGKFRLDLYFRLNVVQIKLPPLRERKSDIPLLATRFMQKFSDLSPDIAGVSDDAMERLVAHDWPGNVRELENVIERAMALSNGRVLHMSDLPSSVTASKNKSPVRADTPGSLEDVRMQAILRAVRKAGGDKTVAARLLGIGKTTMYRKLKKCDAASNGADAVPPIDQSDVLEEHTCVTQTV